MTEGTFERRWNIRWQTADGALQADAGESPYGDGRQQVIDSSCQPVDGRRRCVAVVRQQKSVG